MTISILLMFIPVIGILMALIDIFKTFRHEPKLRSIFIVAAGCIYNSARDFNLGITIGTISWAILGIIFSLAFLEMLNEKR